MTLNLQEWKCRFAVIVYLVWIEVRVEAFNFTNSPEYDFIIVGGGTAGCVLAARLSDNPNCTVLLIEAGGEETQLQDIPLLTATSQYTSADWSYRTEESNSYCLGMVGSRCLWRRGKVLGGSSTLNFMLYTRGNRVDFDGWKALGNPGWGYDDILPYFLEIENMTIPEYANDTTYHSTKGKLTISYPPYHTKLATAFVKAGVEKGFKNVDVNGKNQIGYEYVQATIKNGWRLSSYRAFLEPVRNRSNLHIMTHSLVTKILINKTSATSYGVEYNWLNQSTLIAYAKKEVIVSAGSINSPQLLMLSGIGPKEHLEELGIQNIKDSKVGYNLQDHVSVGNLFFTINESIGLDLNNTYNSEVLSDFFINHTGTLTVPGAIESLGFENLNLTRNGQPQVELLLFSASPLAPTLWDYYDVKIVDRQIIRNLYAFKICPIVLHPYSTGRILLKDKSPFTYPIIRPNYFSDHKDIDTLIMAVRSAIKLMDTEAMQRYNASLYQEPLKECSEYEFNSDTYWECCARYLPFTIFHPCGTCKMGPDSDPDAVVDSSLRVKGIKGLRVVDGFHNANYNIRPYRVTSVYDCSQSS